ncbi:MAG TPA: pyridoxamine 5'-phosphate oxidase family protein [Trebonia sp.]|jgi:hypothetical protein|nr:pyridoxamine 5'-phosphate oxidase family protein [Trebonia sp.]
MDISMRQLTEIPRAEALSLLAGATLGRIVFTAHALPAVRLVSHIVEEAAIVIRSHYGAAIIRVRPEGDGGPRERAANDIVVAYEADEFDSDAGLGWSVAVTGTAALVRDPGDIARYERMLPAWNKDGGIAGQFVRICPEIVTGYRFACGTG